MLNGAETAFSADFITGSFVRIGPLELNQMRDNMGAKHQKKRVGRGNAAGRGRTCGRGHKGTKARAGNHGLLKKGNGNKLQKILPKLGGYRKPEREYKYINLTTLQRAVQRAEQGEAGAEQMARVATDAAVLVGGMHELERELTLLLEQGGLYV